MNPLTSHSYGHDANGNVITLADTSGNIVANYDYSPFGETVRATGPWAAFNPFRFATEYQETSGTYAGRDTGLYYDKNRYYIPAMGRFANRDPLGEAGGVNLYAYCFNDGINQFDPDGNNVYLGLSGAFYTPTNSPFTHYQLLVIDPPTNPDGSPNPNGTSSGHTIEISYQPKYYMPASQVPNNSPWRMAGKIIGNLIHGHPIDAADVLGRPSSYPLTNIKWKVNPNSKNSCDLLPDVTRIEFPPYTIAPTNAADSVFDQVAGTVGQNYDFSLLSNCGVYVYHVVQEAHYAWPTLSITEINFGLNGALGGMPAGSNPSSPSPASPVAPSPIPPAPTP